MNLVNKNLNQANRDFQSIHKKQKIPTTNGRDLQTKRKTNFIESYKWLPIFFITCS